MLFTNIRESDKKTTAHDISHKDTPHNDILYKFYVKNYTFVIPSYCYDGWFYAECHLVNAILPNVAAPGGCNFSWEKHLRSMLLPNGEALNR
jgi:hypothetical protein